MFQLTKDKVVIFLAGIDFAYFDMIVAAVFPRTITFASFFAYFSIVSPCVHHKEIFHTKKIVILNSRRRLIVRRTWTIECVH